MNTNVNNNHQNAFGFNKAERLLVKNSCLEVKFKDITIQRTRLFLVKYFILFEIIFRTDSGLDHRTVHIMSQELRRETRRFVGAATV